MHCFTGVGFYPVWAVRIMCGPLDLTAEKGTFNGGRVAHIPHPVRNMGRAVSTWVEGCAHPSTQRSGPDSLQYGGVACNLCSWIGDLPLVATSSGGGLAGLGQRPRQKRGWLRVFGGHGVLPPPPLLPTSTHPCPRPAPSMCPVIWAFKCGSLARVCVFCVAFVGETDGEGGGGHPSFQCPVGPPTHFCAPTNA